MPLRPFRTVPNGIREWDEWCRNTAVEPSDGTVTEAMLTDNAASNRVLRDSAAYSVIGNPTASGADPSDIAAGSDATFLGRRSGALQFVALLESDIPGTIARDAEVTSAVSSAVSAGITAHEAASDPHPQYTTSAELSAAIASAMTNITSGTYTPTLTNVANLDASTAHVCQYTRVDSVVTVAGRVDIDPTLTATATQLGISLPIASNFATNDGLAGTAFCNLIANQGAAIYADATNDRAQLEYVAVDVSNKAMFFVFQYLII